MYGLTTTTGPAEEPVTLDRAKVHLRVDHNEDDDLITDWIKAARELSETHTGKRWIEQDLVLSLPQWCCGEGDECGVLRLPVQPVSEVESVKYYATDGTLTTLTVDTDYQLWLDHFPPLIAAAPAKVWPTLQAGRMKAVVIEFTAGFPSAAEVPAAAKSAILLCLGYWYENRGDGVDPHRLPQSMGLPPAATRLLDSLMTGAYI